MKSKSRKTFRKRKIVKVLYCTATPSFYRTKFFDQLGRQTELTVLYEAKETKNRGGDYYSKVGNHSYHEIILADDIDQVKRFDHRIVREVLNKAYDVVIIGCFNSTNGVFAQMALALHRRAYLLNIDGEFFGGKKTLKRMYRNWLIGRASGYVIAGEHTGKDLLPLVVDKPLQRYHFTSLTQDEVDKNAKEIRGDQHKRTVLCVAQYLAYKGLDVLLRAAKKLPEVDFLIVGTHQRTELLVQNIKKLSLRNVRVLEYLPQNELIRAYSDCSCFVLPSRQECWGLVINEAASFGVPIVSTDGAGAALDILSPNYMRFLAKPGDADDLAAKLLECLSLQERDRRRYSEYLLNKSRDYTIENMVQEHLRALEDFVASRGEKNERAWHLS